MNRNRVVAQAAATCGGGLGFVAVRVFFACCTGLRGGGGALLLCALLAAVAYPAVAGPAAMSELPASASGAIFAQRSVWASALQRMGQALAPQIVRVALPKMPSIKGVSKKSSPLDVFEGLFRLIANFVLIVLALAVVVVVTVQIISEVQQARSGEGRWRRCFATALGGIAVIILVVYLVNFASTIIS